tara:strand:+ start:512 stop:1990 length:1479 start_codon:yes stop_codon:yes gene_type:complete
MAKNVYFSGGTTTEQTLYEDLIIESLKIYGHDVYYLPREIVKEDDLFGEDVLSKFDENYMIEMYVSNYEGFEGDGTLMTKFGVRITDEATFVIAKRRWEDLIAASNNLVSSFRPNEGDVIYFPLTGQLFQIKFVEHEKPFRMLNDIQTYNLVTEIMEYSGERLETGVEEIDDITRDIGYSLTLKLTDGIKDVIVTAGGSGYTAGSTVTFSGGGGANAAAGATISSGSVTGVKMSEPGVGYTSAPNVAISGGTGAIAIARIGGRGNFVTGEIVNSQINTAQGTANKVGSSISSITINRGGSGYTSAPAIIIGKQWLSGTSYSIGDQVFNGTRIYTAGSNGVSGVVAPTHGVGGATDGGVTWTYAGTKAAATSVLTNGIVTSLTMTETGSGYTSAPKVTFAASPTETGVGKVTRYDVTNKELELVNVAGSFTDNDTVVGQTSGAEWTINTFSTIENENDPIAENTFFETEGDAIIDWTEGNPFGEFGNDSDGVF